MSCFGAVFVWEQSLSGTGMDVDKAGMGSRCLSGPYKQTSSVSLVDFK